MLLILIQGVRKSRTMNMKFFLSFLAISLLYGCSGGVSKNLGGGYELISSDDDHVYIVKNDNDSKKVVIDQQIVDHQIVGSQVFILRKVAISYDCYNEKNIPKIITHYTDKSEFWVIDVKNKKEIGPLTEEGLYLYSQKIGVVPKSFGSHSSYISNTDMFIKWKKDCKVFRSN